MGREVTIGFGNMASLVSLARVEDGHLIGVWLSIEDNERLVRAGRENGGTLQQVLL